MQGDGPDDSVAARGQANLLALVVALAALTAATGLAVVVADGALQTADRDLQERRAAVAAADRIVAPDAPTTRRANVLDRAAVANLTIERLVAIAPPLAERSFRLRVGGETFLARGNPTGPTARRIALLARTDARTRTLNLSNATGLVLPRRTGRVQVAATNATVVTVRADDRVVLHDPDGVDDAVAPLPRERTAHLTVEVEGNETGTLRVTYWPERTAKALVEVTVGD